MNQFDHSRVDETAARMLARYSTARKAEDMAWEHACDYPIGTEPAIYWRLVCEAIRKQRNKTR